jgi:hypothetical protein
VVEPAPPRQLPAQNHAALDADEQRARRVTRAVALLAAGVLVVLVCALCGRVVF